MSHPTSFLAVARARAAKLSRHKPAERLEDRIAPAYTATLNGSTVTFNGDGADDFLNLESVGGFLKHSRALAGDPGFASDFDMVSGDGATETKLPTSGAYTVLVNAGAGEDTIAIGTINNSGGNLGNGTFTINGEGSTNDIINFYFPTDTTPRTVNLSATQVTTPGGPTVNYSNVEQVNFSMGTGNNTFNLSGSAVGTSYHLAGNSATDTVNVTADGDFTLTDSLLTVAASGFGSPFKISGGIQPSIDVVNLTGGLGSNTFDLSGWTKTSTITGGGGIGDKIVVTRDTDFTLTNSTLSTADGMNVSLVNVPVATLKGGPGANTFNVNGWGGTATLDGANAGADKFNITFAGSGFGTINVTAGAGVDALVANGTSGGDSFTLTPGKIALGNESITYTAAIDSVTVDGKGGNDPVSINTLTPIASANTSFTYIGGGQSGDVLSFTGTGAETVAWNAGAADAGSVTVGGGTYHYSTASGGLSFANFAGVTLATAAGSDNYTLDGSTSTLSTIGQKAVFSLVPSLAVNFGQGDGPSTPVADIFNVSGIPVGLTSVDVKLGSGADQLNISGVTTLAGVTFTANGGATGPDTISFTGNTDVTLTDSALTITGGSISIAEFENAVLTGGSSANHFTISGWTGTGSIDGQGGTDTLIATNDVATVGLSDTTFTRELHGTFTLTSIEAATLTGGPGSNAFTISGYTGNASVTGGGGSDSLDFTAATGLTLTLLDDTTSTIGYNNSAITANAIGSFHLHGSGLGLSGDTQATALWTPSATGNVGGGSLDLSENGLHRLVSYDGALVAVSQVDTLTLQTPAGADAITLGSDGNGSATIGGSVGGPNPYALSTSIQQVPTLVIDLGANDASGGAADTITINSLTGESSLGSLSLKTGEGDDVITFASGVTSLNLPFPSGGVSVDAGAGTDQIVANSPSTDMELAHNGSSSSLGYGGTSGLEFSGVERFDLTARSLALTGTDAETVAWTPGHDAVLNSALGAHAGSLDAAGSFFGTVVYHLDPSGTPLTINHVYTLNLTTQAGADTFTLDAGASNGEVTLSGTAGTDAHAATLSDIPVLSLDFGANDTAAAVDQLTVKSLGATGLTTLTVKTGNGDDTLVLDSGLTSLALGSNPGEGFSFDGGFGSDTIKLASSAALNLGPTTLAIGNSAPLTHFNTEHFVLDGGVSGQVNFTGAGTEDVTWRPDGALTQHGVAEFSGKDLTYVGQLGVFSAKSLFVAVAAGPADLTVGATATLGQIDGTTGTTAHHAIFGGVPTLTLSLTAMADTVTVNQLTAPGLVNFGVLSDAGDDTLTIASTVGNLKHSTFDPGLGHDTLNVTADLSMDLADGSLSYTDNTNHTTDLGKLTFVGSALEAANLTGGAGANRFRFLGFGGTTTAHGAAGDDTFDLSGGFTGTGSFLGEGDNDTFILQTVDATLTTRLIAGAGGGATIDGGAGSDTLQAQANLDMALTDALFTRTIPKTKTTPAQSISNTISGLEHAILGGAASPNLLDARQFSGVADLSGEGGIDNLLASKGGGDLYGYHANATVSDTKSKLYTRDNFFASAGNTTDLIHATKHAGNILSFRYSTSAIKYTMPNTTGATVAVGGGLNIELVEGTLNGVEGSIYGDHLTGNNLTDFLIGGKGNDVLRAVGFDYLYGGPGRDTLLGTTPFKYQDLNYPIPNSTGVTAVRYPAPFPRPDSFDAIAALIVRE